MLGLAGEVDSTAPLMDLGMNSQSSMELRRALAVVFPGIPLPVTLAFDYPTLQQIARFMQGDQEVEEAGTAPEVRNASRTMSRSIDSTSLRQRSASWGLNWSGGSSPSRALRFTYRS